MPCGVAVGAARGVWVDAGRLPVQEAVVCVSLCGACGAVGEASRHAVGF